jgi:hypothetical protein
MKTRIAAVLAAGLACGALCGSPASAAQGNFADSICPEATQYVIAVGKLTKSDPAQRVYDAAQATVDAYARCSKDKLANGAREPEHYADTRGAQFAVLAARALILLDRRDDARRELKQYRALAQNVVDWDSDTGVVAPYHKPVASDKGGEVPFSSTPENVSNSRRGSLYRATAKEIVGAIDELLAQLDEHAAQPQPAASAAPGH